MFPDLPLEPDTYAAEWFLDDGALAGEVELLGGQPPRAHVYGEPKGLAAPVRTIPADLELGILKGRLRRGHDVLLGDTTLSVWFPGRTMGFGRWALAGLRI